MHHAILLAGPTDALDPSEWEGLSRALGPSAVLAFIVVLTACICFVYAIRAVFGKKGLAERTFARFSAFLTGVEERQKTQTDLCKGMARLHEPGARCDVGPLIQAAHPAAQAIKKIADKMDADIENEIREVHAALDGRS